MPHAFDPLVYAKIHHFIQEHALLPRGTHALCAVSGGADSVFLLRFLHQYRDTLGLFGLTAAHFNHLLRDEADGDWAFVRDLCAAWDIPLFFGSGSVAYYSKRWGTGEEETARRMRYAFLQDTALEIGASRIVTGHTAGDNLETVLLHMIRGCGLRGLTGIPPVRDNIVRPLLNVTRTEIERVLSEQGLSHREDASNADTRYTRNRLRHNVVPELVRINPRLVETVGAMARRFREDEDYLSALADRALESLSGPLSAQELAALPSALFARIMPRLHSEAGGVTALTARHIEALRRWCAQGGAHARIMLPDGIQAVRSYDTVSFARTAAALPNAASSAGGLLRYVVEGPFAPPLPVDPDVVWLDEAVDARGLIARARLAGDMLRLPGKPGRRSLKRLMIDRKIPAALRDRLPVLTDAGGDVVAVCGLGTDARFAPRPGYRAWAARLLPQEEIPE